MARNARTTVNSSNLARTADRAYRRMPAASTHRFRPRQIVVFFVFGHYDPAVPVLTSLLVPTFFATSREQYDTPVFISKKNNQGGEHNEECKNLRIGMSVVVCSGKRIWPVLPGRCSRRGQ